METILPFGFIYVGRDFYRGPYSYCFLLGLFDRGETAPLGEYRYRFNFKIGIYRTRLGTWVFFRWLCLIPAWQDEPTALAEYQRTMRGRR
jgi:hypothetical protein